MTNTNIGTTARTGIGMVAILAAFLVMGCASHDAVDNAETPAATPAQVEDSEREDVQVQFVGVWEGSLKVQGAEIDIAVKFLQDPTVAAAAVDLRSVATMDIPVQMAYGLPLTNVSATGNSAGAAIHFELVTSGPTLVADGEITADAAISGVFSQGGASGEFALTRVADLEAADLPAAGQTATGIETAASVEIDGGTLHGTLLMPETDAQAPLVIIVAGSGPTDRDGNSHILPGRNDSLKLLAEGLARAGIASLRYDKRGLGESVYEGLREEDLIFADFVNDLLSWVQWADTRGDLSNTYLAGHSEGGLIVLSALAADLDVGLGVDPRAARLARDTVSGVICIAAPGRVFDAVVLEQLERSLGPDSALFTSARQIFAAIRDGSTVPEVPQELASLFRPSVQPYLRSIVQFDPAVLAAATPQPLLVVNGVEDLQVPVSEAEALSAARPDARLVVIPGMNHVLKIVPPADLAANQRSYTDPSFGLSEELVNAVSEFVLGQ
ncbi:MAG: lysophospholipase [Spirochaetales bacterium]|nr:lysophospholipase [Spirochaetales bacterium]